MQEYQYLSDVLKEVYAPAIVDQIPKKSPLWAIFEKKTADFAGKQYVIPVQLAFSEAVGGRAANNYNLPDAQRNLYDQTYIKMKRMYGRVMIDGFSIESAKGKGGWVDVLTAEIKGVTNAFSIDIDRQLLCGGTGTLGLVKTAITSSQAYINVKDAAGITGNIPATKFFRKGMVITVGSGSTEYQITSVDEANGNIYITPNISSASVGDAIYRAGVYSSTADDIGEMMGIDGIVGTGNAPGSTFQGIDASAEPLWRAYVNTTSTVFSESAIQSALDEIDKNTDGETVDLLWTTYGVRNKFIAVMQTLRALDTITFTGGWKAIKYVGGNVELPIMVHPKMHQTSSGHYIYFLSTKHIKRYELLPLTWDDKGGGVVKPVAGKDAYEAWFKIYTNLGTDCRNAHGKLTTVTIS